MRRLIAVLPLLLASAVPVVAHETEEKVYTITVSGEAVVAAVPDRAVISLSVQGPPAKKRREAEEKQSRLAQNLVMILKVLGVGERDIKSQYYSLQDYYEQKDGKNERKGFHVIQSFSVRVPREKVSAVLDAVPDFATPQGVEYSVSNERKLRDEATGAAIDDALARAQERAGRLGIRLGPVLGYQESALGRPQAREKGMRITAAMADSAAPEVPAGEDELHVNVSVTFQILLK